MAEPTRYSVTRCDEQLPAAVAAATSWRGVMRELGLNPANGGTTRTIRRHAALLGLDTSHFRSSSSLTRPGSWFRSRPQPDPRLLLRRAAADACFPPERKVTLCRA